METHKYALLPKTFLNSFYNSCALNFLLVIVFPRFLLQSLNIIISKRRGNFSSIKFPAAYPGPGCRKSSLS